MWIIIAVLGIAILWLAANQILWKRYPCTLMVYIEYSADFLGTVYDFSKYKDTGIIYLTVYEPESFEKIAKSLGLWDEIYEYDEEWLLRAIRPKVFPKALVIKDWKGRFECKY